MHSGKDDTFILDFVNDRETILNSFQPYYELTTVDENTDPNHLYDLKAKLDEKQIYWQSEIDNFANIYFKSKEQLSVKDQAKLYALLDPAVDRYKDLNEDDQDEFKKMIRTWDNLYSFLSQIIPFQDAELEKFFAFSRLLNRKLPKRDISERMKLDDDVALEYYRLKKIEEAAISLEKNITGEVSATSEAGISRSDETKAKLSEIISMLNDRFATDFDDADKLFFDQIEAELVKDDTLRNQAKSNNMDNFKFGFDDAFLTKLIERMEDNKEIFERILGDNNFGNLVKEWMLKRVYDKLNEK